MSNKKFVVEFAGQLQPKLYYKYEKVESEVA